MNMVSSNNYRFFFAVIITLFCFNITTYSQDYDYFDSLKDISKNQPDSEKKVDNFLLLSKGYYQNYQMDSAKQYSMQAMELSKKLDYTEGAAEALYMQSLITYRIGDFNTSLERVNLFLDFAESLQDSIKMGKGYWLRGTLLRETNDLINAKNDYKTSLSIFQNNNDTSRMLSVFQSIGNLYFDLAEYDSAAIYYHKTIDFCVVLSYETGVAAALNQLGKTMFYLPIPQYKEAKRLIRKSLEINKKHDKLHEISLNYSNLASIALEMNELDTAMYYYEKVKEINIEIGNKIGMIHYYNNIAEVYEIQGRFEKALKNYNIALAYYRQQNIDEGIIVALQNIADIYVELHQYKFAHEYYDSSIIFAKKTGYKQRLKNGLINKTDAYIREEKYKDAYEYHLMLDELSDSIFNLEKAEIIADLKFKYEKEKDQAQILALEKENLEKDLRYRTRTNQRNIYLYSSIGIICVILFIAIYFRLKARKDKIISEQTIRQLQDEKKILAAKSLVEGQEEERKRVAKELHDGLGVLLSTAKIQFSSIKDESSENQNLIEKASKLLDQATGDVRKISHNMMPGLLTKFGLFEAVEELIENVNEANDLVAKCEISGEKKRLAENAEIMIYRVIQELVNNTLKHAKAKNIRLDINILPNIVKIDFSDDGVGFNVEEMLKSQSIGLQSIQSRIHFLNGGLYIDSQYGKGAMFNIEIPYNLN